MSTRSSLVKFLVFVAATLIATGTLAATIANTQFGDKLSYKAVFQDVTGLAAGQEVRIAGVRVGEVKRIGLARDRVHAEVDFDVLKTSVLTAGTKATIKYRNLVGERYIALTQEVGGTAPLKDGAVLGLDHTQSALDLTVLFNGFKPLFEALSPDDINKLSFEIVQVFQGEGGTLEGLLSSTASITQTLADRDEVIGQLLENLDYVLDHVADRDKQLTNLIDSFRSLVGGLNDDREAILSSLDSISELSVQTAALVTDIKDPFVKDVKELRKVATTLNRNRKEIDRALQVLPVKLTKIGRTAIYGSWFNFYLCHFKTTIKVPGLKNPLGTTIPINAPRCSLKKEVGE